MSRFRPGQSGNPKGRPAGSKDMKWKSIQAMWDLLMAEFDKLTPAQRAHYSFEMVKLHFERAIAQLPKEQSESLTNANKLMEELKELEAKTIGTIRDSANQTGMAGRKTPL